LNISDNTMQSIISSLQTEAKRIDPAFSEEEDEDEDDPWLCVNP